MRDASKVLWRALTARQPLVVVLFRAWSRRSPLADEVEALAPPDAPVVRTGDVDAGIERPDAVVILLVEDEVAAVTRLEGRRDALTDRAQPIVLLLLAGGDGEAALRKSPGIASWLLGRVLDLDAPQPPPS